MLYASKLIFQSPHVGFGRFSFNRFYIFNKKFISPTCLIDFRKKKDTLFIGDNFFACLMCIYFSLVSIFYVLHVFPHQNACIPFLRALSVYLFTCLTTTSFLVLFFVFQIKKTNRFFTYVLL